MTTPIQLVILARDESAKVLQGTVANFDNLGRAAVRAGDSLARGSASAGQWRTAITGLGSEATRALGSVSAEAQNAASAISGIGGAVASFSAVGLVIAAAGFALKAFNESAAQAQQRVANVQKPFEDLKNSLRAMDATPLDRIAASANMSSDAMRKLAESSEAVRGALMAVAEAQERVATASERARIVAEAQSQTYGMLNDNADKYGVSIQGLWATLTSAPQFFGGMFTAIQQGVGITGNFNAVLADLDEKQTKAEHSASVLSMRLREQADAAAMANSHAAEYAATLGQVIALTAGQANAAASLAQAEATVDGWMVRLGAGNKAYNDVQERGARLTDEYNAANQRLAEQGLARARAAMQQLISTLRSVVEGVLQATSVTDTDMAAAAMGKYVDKWDEFRRRLDAVASGTSAAQFGAQFQEMFEKLGMSAEEASRKFKDFSLFANPANLKLINWDAIVGSTSEAIDSIIGKYNVVTAGVKAYLESDAAAAQLPQLKLALGLSVDASQADVQQALTGALGGISGDAGAGASVAATVKTTLDIDTSAAKARVSEAQKLIALIPASTAGVTVTTRAFVDDVVAKKSLGELIKLVGQIPASVAGTTVTTIVDIVKKDSFDDNLKDILDALDKIPREIEVQVNVVGGTSEGGATATEPTPTNNPAVPQQHGGMGVLAKNTLFLAHAGEGFWFSGVPWRIPPPAAGGRGGGNITPVFDFRGAQFVGSSREVVAMLQQSLSRMIDRRLDAAAIAAANYAQLQG
jgi:hypothetical protein